MDSRPSKSGMKKGTPSAAGAAKDQMEPKASTSDKGKMMKRTRINETTSSSSSGSIPSRNPSQEETFTITFELTEGWPFKYYLFNVRLI